MKFRSRICRTLASVSLVINTGAQAAEPPTLGRLFFTPEWRANIERQRELADRQTRTHESGALRLDGVVMRSTGQSTAWINHRPQSGSDSGTHLENLGDLADLKVGATLDRATGKTTGGLADGEIRVSRTPSRP